MDPGSSVIVSGACSIGALVGLLRVWQPKDTAGRALRGESGVMEPAQGVRAARTLGPGLSGLAALADSHGVHRRLGLAPIQGRPGQTRLGRRLPCPTSTRPCSACRRWPRRGPNPRPPQFKLNVLSATGTGILMAAIAPGLTMGFSLRDLGKTYLETVWRIRFSLLDHRGHAGAGQRDEVLGRGRARWAWPWRGPGSFIRSSARCWAGWGWP